MNAIEVKELVRKYGDFVAVKGVNFEVKEGEIFGFLWPKGAGKTTTINILCTLLRPSAGSARADRYDIATHLDTVRQSIGLIFQDPSLEESLAGRESLQFQATPNSVPGALSRKRAEELLAWWNWRKRPGNWCVATLAG